MKLLFLYLMVGSVPVTTVGTVKQTEPMGMQRKGTELRKAAKEQLQSKSPAKSAKAEIKAFEVKPAM